MPGEQLMQDTAERVQIGPAIDRRAGELFRRHVRKRSEEAAGGGHP